MYCHSVGVPRIPAMTANRLGASSVVRWFGENGSARFGVRDKGLEIRDKGLGLGCRV